jgi:hypothetical protein
VLLVEVLRSWIKSLDPGEGGWLGAIADPHTGKALQLIHEGFERPWTLGEVRRFSARFTRLVGQPMHRYLERDEFGRNRLGIPESAAF